VTPAQACQAYLAAFATGDADEVTAWVTDDFINEHTAALGTGCVGKAEYAARVPGFLASMPALRYDIEDTLAEGDRVAIAYVLRATINERDIAVRGVMRFRVEGELIAHRIDYWDSLVFKQQAGLT
jgi:ketosteroid isomerase-like protein